MHAMQHATSTGLLSLKVLRKKTHPHGTQCKKEQQSASPNEDLIITESVLSSGLPRAKATCTCPLLGLPPSTHSPSSQMPLTCSTARTAGIHKSTNLSGMILTCHRVCAPAQASSKKSCPPRAAKRRLRRRKGTFQYGQFGRESTRHHQSP